MPDEFDRPEEQALRLAILRMRVHGLGVSVALLFALVLFGATNFLIFRGGEHVGAHLGLLAAYFPGYRVSFIGSLIGSIYALVVGYLIGCTVGVVYNWLVDR